MTTTLDDDRDGDDRQELLVATRHILSTDFRTDFVQYIDVLATERVLLGFGTTSVQNLR